MQRKIITTFMPLLLTAFVCSSCAHERHESQESPRAPDYSTSAALRDAAADIESGHPKIFIAGTIVRGEVGIDDSNASFVMSLPRSHALPAGCTVAGAAEAIEYARTYNRAVAEALAVKSKE